MSLTTIQSMQSMSPVKYVNVGSTPKASTRTLQACYMNYMYMYKGTCMWLPCSPLQPSHHQHFTFRPKQHHHNILHCRGNQAGCFIITFTVRTLPQHLIRKGRGVLHRALVQSLSSSQQIPARGVGRGLPEQGRKYGCRVKLRVLH